MAEEISKRILRDWWHGRTTSGPKVAQIADSILSAVYRGHTIKYCEVSPAEWRELCQEHFGGPWFGLMKIAGVTVIIRQEP